MESSQLQQLLFEHIKKNIRAHLSLVDEVSEVLDISTDSAYRRIRGDKILQYEELQKLAMHYRLSIDGLLNLNTDSTIFHGSYITRQNFDFSNYLRDMFSQLQHVNSFENKEFYFEAKDIPPFYFFQFPELASFKYFFWMKTILQYPEYAKSHYDPEVISKAILETGKNIIEAYCQVPSIEFWSVDTVNVTLRQIEFYKESGVIRKKDHLILLYDQFLALVEHVEKQADVGGKFITGQPAESSKASFKLYYNEVMLGQNIILALTGSSKTVYLIHGLLNYLITADQRFCDYTHESMQNLMRKSVLISETGEKERNKFFNILKEKITSKRDLVLSA